MGWRGISICILLATLVTYSQQGRSVSECPEGWTERTAMGKCSYYYNETKTYEEAKRTCENIGATLPTAKNMAQAVLITEMHKGQSVYNFWLGLTDLESEGVWRWDDGTSADNLRWDENEPRGETDEDCVIVAYPRYGLWQNVMCSSLNEYHCMIDLKPKSTKCPPGFEYDGVVRCIFMSQTKVTYKEAKRTCNDLGASLPIVKEEDEGVLLHSKMKWHFWLGMTDENSEGVWMWDDDTRVEKTRWYYREPNGGRRENCAVMHNTRETVWGDVSCSLLVDVMCIKSVAPPEKTTWTECPEGWITVAAAKKCIQEYRNFETYTSAKAACTYLGGSLPIAKTMADSVLWRELYSDYSIWIGMSDKRSEGSWEWDDGTPVKSSLQRWNASENSEPNSAPDYNCAMVMQGLDPDWRASQCTTLRRFICERELDRPTITIAGPQYPVSSDVCPPGFKTDVSNWCYFASANTKLTYLDAKQVCKDLGSSLPMIKNMTPDNYAISTMNPNKMIWLGLYHWVDWRWNDGEVVTEEGARFFHPRSFTNPYVECAVMMVEDNHDWKIHACTLKEYFVCTHEYIPPTTAAPLTTTTAEETTTTETSEWEDKDPEKCAQAKKEGSLEELCKTRGGYKKCTKSCEERKNASFLVDIDPKNCESRKKAGTLGKFCKSRRGKKQCLASCDALKNGPTADANPELCQQKKDAGELNKYFCKKKGKKLCKLSCKKL